MRNYVLMLIVLTVLISCKNNTKVENLDESVAVVKNYDQINQLQWLLGTWVNEFTPEYSKESWIQENDSTYSAYSFTRVRQDTVFAESIILQQKEGNLLMTVADAPNNENAVTFRLISADSGQFIFENKNHDFPQRIVYTNPVKDSLYAWIEGPVEGEMKKLHFHFSKEN